MTLSDCTKADLLWIINRVKQRYLHNVDFEIQRALNDLEYEKIRQRHDEAERYVLLANEKRREYIELLSPYDGMKIIDIPLPVLDKADKLLKKAREYDKRWNKLIGLDDKRRARRDEETENR